MDYNNKEPKSTRELSAQDQLDASRRDYELFYSREVLSQIDRNVNWPMRLILHRLCWLTWRTAREMK